MKRHIWVLLLLASSLSGCLLGQNQEVLLTLSQAIQNALAQRPQLLRVEEEIKAAEARLKQARSGYFPQIGFGGIAKQGLSGAGSAFGLEGLASSPFPRDLAASINVSYDLFDFGRRKHRTAAHRLRVSALKESRRSDRSRVVLQVKRAYYAVLEARKRIELGSQTVRERELTVKQSSAFYRAQLKSKLDVSLAQVELSRARLGVVQAESAYSQALVGLNRSMGAPYSGVYALEEPGAVVQPPGSLPSLVQGGLADRPELKSLDAEIAAYEEWLKKAESEKKGKILAAFSGGITRFAELTAGRLLFGGIGIRLPIYTGGRLEGQIEEARHTLKSSLARRQILSRDIEEEVARAHSRLTTARYAIEPNQDIVAQAQQTLELARLRYKAQLGDFVELARAETALSSAETEYARALYDYKLSEAELLYATGSIHH